MFTATRETVMIYLIETFGSFNGSGYLTFGSKWRLMVGYKFVLRRDSLTGGGVIFGLSEKNAIEAAELQNVYLEFEPNRFFQLVVGCFDGESLVAAVTGVGHP
jgi:hypothetical protein